MSRSSQFSVPSYHFSNHATRKRAQRRKKSYQRRFESLENRHLLAANVFTDLPDYAPGATAHIFASDFALGEPVQFQVLHNDGTPNTGNGHLPWTVVDGSVDDLDGLTDGNIHTTWYVDPDDSADSAFDLTALGLTSGLEAATTFTDAPSTDYKHFRNNDPPITAADWINGALQNTNSIYFEGDVVPHWYEVAKAVEGVTYSFNIYYDYRKDLAIDEGGFLRLNSYNFTENPPLAGAAAPVIDNAFPEAGNIYTVNANVTTIAGPVEVAGSTNQRYVTVTFVANDGDMTAGEEITAEFYWGLQLAQPGDVGPGSKGASAFSGASLQSDVNVSPAVVGSTMIGGGGKLQINPNAVVRGEISGFKFHDLNGNGTMDGGEPGLADWTIELYKDDGDSIFEPGPGGDILVTELTSDGTDDVNGDGIADPLGYYEFSPLTRGTYFVREVQQPGWSQTTPVPNLYTITITQTTPVVEIKNFGNRQLGAISGKKFNDLDGDGTDDGGSDPGLAGWTIELDKGANGTVDATTVTGARWRLLLHRPHGRHLPDPRSGPGRLDSNHGQSGRVTVVSGTNSTGNNFGNFQLGVISGKKFNDLDGDGTDDGGSDPGLAGWTIELDKGANGTVDATTVTGAGGAYSFTGLTAGTYRIREVGQVGLDSNHGHPADVTVVSGTNSTGNNFGNFQLGVISGKKFNDLDGDGTDDGGSDPGLAGWTIELDKGANGTVDATTVTGAGGAYSFTGLTAGTYRIREVGQVGWTQNHGQSGRRHCGQWHQQHRQQLRQLPAGRDQRQEVQRSGRRRHG